MQPTQLGFHFIKKFNKEINEFIVKDQRFKNQNTINKSNQIYKTLYTDLCKYFLLNDEIPLIPKVVNVNINDEYLSELKNNQFASKEIKQYCFEKIKKKESKLLSFNFEIDNIKYQVNYIFFKQISKALISNMKKKYNV